MFTFIAFVFAGLALSLGAQMFDPECSKQPPTGVNIEKCCSVPDFIEDSIYQGCVSELMATNQTHEVPSANAESQLYNPTSFCLTECVFNKTGIYKDDVFYEEKLMDGVHGFWRPIVRRAIEFCLLTSFQIDIGKLQEGKCNAHLTLLVACVDTQVFKNCPHSLFTNSIDCRRLRATAEKCPISLSLLRGEEPKWH